MNITEIITHEYQEHINLFQDNFSKITQEIEEVAKLILTTLENKGKIILFGNGGSAADAQHIAAELIGRFRSERGALPAIALTTDSSILTAVANDYGYEVIFSRQMEALCTPKDLAIGISTSGNSLNVIKAIETANNIGAVSICFLGKDGGKLKSICKNSIIVPSNNTARIQEMHIMIGHIICQIIDNKFTNNKDKS